MAFDYSAMKDKYEEVMVIVMDDLKGIQTGRAKPSLVEDVMVEAYGGKMPLKEVASISAADATMIVIQPWDKGIIEAVEKGLNTGKNQFNASVDGQVVRVKIVALTGEKREELVKLVHQRIESGKKMLREERNDTKKQVEDQKGEAGISEDDIKRDLEELDKITGEYVERLEKVGEDKTRELRTL